MPVQSINPQTTAYSYFANDPWNIGEANSVDEVPADLIDQNVQRVKISSFDQLSSVFERQTWRNHTLLEVGQGSTDIDEQDESNQPLESTPSRDSLSWGEWTKIDENNRLGQGSGNQTSSRKALDVFNTNINFSHANHESTDSLSPKDNMRDHMPLANQENCDQLSFKPQNHQTTTYQIQISIGIAALFFCAMKVLYQQNCLSVAGNKEHIEELDKRNTLIHERNIEEIKKIHENEKASTSWSTAMSVFSWMTSFTEILAGAFLCAAGNVVSGALLIAGGIIQLTSQVMQITGGWDKVGELLPTEDPQERQAIVYWMQIGIGILSLMLGGAGGVLSGKAAAQEGMSMANQFITYVLMAGVGVCSIGTGINGNALFQARARAKLNEKELEEIRMRRKDLMEESQVRVERIQEIVAAIGFIIKILDEQNRATQRILGG